MTCKINNLKVNASDARKEILNMAYRGNSGHIGCAFSIVELVLVSYSKFIKLNLEDSRDPKRDFFVLSKGHGVMALYVCLADLGFIDKTHLENYFSDGSLLHGLGEFGVPGVEASGGSLGHGICVAQGMAFGLKNRKSDQKVFCLVGDGEINEGSFWETVMFSSAKNLSNLTIIIDKNGFQAMGTTIEVLDMGSLEDKFRSFGFHTEKCDGHDVNDITSALEKCTDSDRPSVLIAKTVKGKGISLFENNNNWHYMKMTGEIYNSAMNELL
jgi:transketolase